jgi:hypothetical protein
MTSYIDLRSVAEDFLVAYPHSNLYFLLDHGGLPGLDKELMKCGVAWSSLFENAMEAAALVVAPILISVCSKGRLVLPRRILDWVAKKGTFSSSIVILTSPLEIDEVWARLSWRLEVRLSEDMGAMLRFYDPRVLEGLVKVMSKDQKKQFLGLAESWRYVDRLGKLVEIRTLFNDCEDFSAPLILSQEQESSLIDASEIDQVLDQLWSNFPECMGSIEQSERYISVRRHIGAAKELGFYTVFQLLLYSAKMLLDGEGFIESPLYPEFLGEVRRNYF